MKALLETGYGILNKLADAMRSPFLLLVRLYWGWQFMQTGWGKLHNLPKVIDFFTSLGLPMPAVMAPAIACVELGGGLLLALGLGSRLIGLILTVNMLMAYITADREAFFSFLSDPDKFAAAAPFTFLFASLIVLTCGSGRLALDTLIGSWWKKQSGSSPASA